MEKTHKQKKNEITRQLMLSAVRKMALKDGWESISTRKIAEKVNYSTIKIYEEFGSKEGLLLALQKVAFEKMKKYIDAAAAQSKTPTEKFKRVTFAVWNFANEQPELFQIMFAMKGAPCTSAMGKQQQVFGNYLWQQVEAVIPKDNASLMFNWWALVYGFISLGVGKPFSKKEMDQMFSESINRLVKTIK